MALSGTIQQTVYNNSVLIINQDTSFFTRCASRQFVPFQLILNNSFPATLLTNTVEFTYDNTTTVYNFVDKLNNTVTAEQLLRYQQHYGRPCIMNCMLDRAYKVVRIESCLSPKTLQVPSTPGTTTTT